MADFRLWLAFHYKTDIEKVGQKFWAMYQCIINITVWNDWSKVTYSQVHGSPVLRTLSFKSLSWISATTFAEFIKFGRNPKLRRPRSFWGEILVFHWRKISYFKFTFIFPLVQAFISKLYIYTSYIYLYIERETDRESIQQEIIFFVKALDNVFLNYTHTHTHTHTYIW